MVAEFALFGARLRTMDPSRPPVGAVAWSGGRILAVGADDEVRAVCGARTETIDAAGLTVTPGLVDGHQHLFAGAELGQGVDFDRVATLEGLRSRIRAERERVGPGGWVKGFGVEHTALEGARYHHTLLDDAAGDGPMVLLCFDLHTAFANAHALRLAGVTGPVDFGSGAIVACDDDGPTGELNEMPAMRLVMDQIPVPTTTERRRWYRDAIAAQNAVGITAIHQMDGTLDTYADLAALEDEGPLDLRVLMHHFVHPTTGDDEIAEFIAAKTRSGGQWQADGVKFMLDGIIDTGTAWLEEQDTHGAGRDPNWPDLPHFHRRIRQYHDR